MSGTQTNIADGRYKVTFPDDATSWYIGRVAGEHFHVEDVIHGEVSQQKLLGAKPNMRPVAMTRLHEEKAHFLPIHED